jgi:hypothetical protein
MLLVNFYRVNLEKTPPPLKIDFTQRKEMSFLCNGIVTLLWKKDISMQLLKTYP